MGESEPLIPVWLRFALSGAVVGAFLGVPAGLESGATPEGAVILVLRMILAGMVAAGALLGLRNLPYYVAWGLSGVVGLLVVGVPEVFAPISWIEFLAAAALGVGSGVSLGYFIQLFVGDTSWLRQTVPASNAKSRPRA